VGKSSSIIVWAGVQEDICLCSLHHRAPSVHTGFLWFMISGTPPPFLPTISPGGLSAGRFQKSKSKTNEQKKNLRLPHDLGDDAIPNDGTRTRGGSLHMSSESRLPLWPAVPPQVMADVGGGIRYVWGLSGRTPLPGSPVAGVSWRLLCRRPDVRPP